MKIMNKTILSLILAIFMAAPFMVTSVQAQEAASAKPDADAVTLQELLDRVKQGRARDNSEFRKREQEFRANRNRQKTLLTNTQKAIAREEARSERLEKTFNENELKLAELEGLLAERLGVFGELFGIVRQVAGETKAQLEESMTSGELKGRSEPLEVLAKSKGLPEISQLEILWSSLTEEMIAQGQVKRFAGEVIDLDGKIREDEILRVGPFTALNENGFVRYAGDGRYADLERQPATVFVDAGEDLFDEDNNVITTGVVDPSRGAILNLALQLPTLGERINQGGYIGYLIILLGIVGVLYALVRIFQLYGINRIVKQQLAKGDASDNPDTPLGRIWAAYMSNQSSDVEALELKLDDAILKELPALEKGLAMLKLIAGVAPLMGLLGTVTGMIITFQAITLYGTGDPKLMAGGISQALITTVLGLVVAIPVLLLHAVASSRSKEVVQILEEQAAGLIARRAEQK